MEAEEEEKISGSRAEYHRGVFFSSTRFHPHNCMMYHWHCHTTRTRMHSVEGDGQVRRQNLPLMLTTRTTLRIRTRRRYTGRR